MGDFWSGETDYDRNEGERDKKRKRDEAIRAKAATERIQQQQNSPGESFSIYGNSDTLNATGANLSQVSALTGKSIGDVGRDASQYDQLLKNRLSGGDPVAQYMMDQRNRNMANVGRQFAGKGVAGGVAAAGMNTAQNEADSNINAQMFQNQKANQDDLLKSTRYNQKVQGNALALGMDQGLADQIKTEAGTGITVICGELHRQGLLSLYLYNKDSYYGSVLRLTDRAAHEGYICWAKHLVPIMAKSKLFTRAVAVFAIPWAEHIAGHKNLIGGAIMMFGLPACRLIGRIKIEVEARSYGN